MLGVGQVVSSEREVVILTTDAVLRGQLESGKYCILRCGCEVSVDYVLVRIASLANKNQLELLNCTFL